jgi:hypothetical protein
MPKWSEEGGEISGRRASVTSKPVGIFQMQAPLAVQFTVTGEAEVRLVEAPAALLIRDGPERDEPASLVEY